MADSTKKMKAIPHEIEQLEKAVSCLESVMGDLQARLSSILRNEPEAGCESEKVCGQECPLSGDIAAKAYRIETQNGNIQRILGQLEI